MCFWQGCTWTHPFRHQSASKKTLTSNEVRDKIYKKLVPETREIRLVTIAQSSLDSEVRVTLRTVPLSDIKGEYCCLSYAWGDEGDQMPILVDGFRCTVTRNLYSLLRRLRAMKRNKDIWIDALCINQWNSAEKDSQVLMMHSIYTDAAEVLIGLDATRTHSIADRPDQHTIAESTLEGLANDLHIKDLKYFQAQVLSKNPTRQSSSTFGQILDSSWFDRTWVVQETCLANSALFLCPWGELKWETFNNAFSNWNKHSEGCCRTFTDTLSKDLVRSCDRMYLYMEAISYTRGSLRGPGQHITAPMLNYQHLEVSNHRDKIYAFRGLHTEPSSGLPEPDYTQTLAVVFRDFFIWVLKDSKSLLLLGMDTCFGNAQGFPDDLPTWIPTWPTFKTDQGIERGNRAKARGRFFQCYMAARGLPMKVDWKRECPKKLRLAGIAVDRVSVRAEKAFTGSETCSEHVELMKAWYRVAYPGHIDGHQCLDDMYESFYAVLLAGVFNDRDQGETRLLYENDPAIMQLKDVLVEMREKRDSFRCSDSQKEILNSHAIALLDRVMFRTEGGRVGIGSCGLDKGDEVFILGGGNAPFLLRPVAHKCTHQLVGHCYVDGMMKGEIKLQSVGSWVVLV